MQVTAFEGIVENGQIQLKTDISLPEKTQVYVIIPGLRASRVAHVFSPRLAYPEQAAVRVLAERRRWLFPEKEQRSSLRT
jgi:hypothetical protein